MNEGDAQQRTLLAGSPATIGFGSVGQRPGGSQGDDGVQRGVQLLDAGEEVPREVHTGNLTFIEAFTEFADTEVVQLLDHSRHDI